MEWLWLSIGIGLLGSLCIAGLAYWKKSLSVSGLLAAVAVGTALYTMGSLAWYGTLLAFFISSTGLSKWKQQKKRLAESAYEKSGRRDAGQVAANGALAALLCVISFLWEQPVWWAAFVGVMAAVNADTWATEIGGISRTLPRSILSGKQVSPGTSGGITRLGSLAAAAGGLFIGIVAWLLLLITPEQMGSSIPTGAPVQLISLLVIGLLAGLVGSFTDSLLGATCQRMYSCSVCGKEVEKERHCGKATFVFRGAAFMNNDGVNFISSLVAGGFAAAAFAFLERIS